MGSIYTATLFIGITNATAAQPVVSIERFVSYRERAAGMYSALPFAYAQVVIEFPYVFAQTIIYCTIFYSMASFENIVGWEVTKSRGLWLMHEWKIWIGAQREFCVCYKSMTLYLLMA